MSRFNGRQSPVGDKKAGRKNKGILKAYREKKRIEAEVRQEDVDPRKTKAFRLGSSYDLNTGKRRPWKTSDWRIHDNKVAKLQDEEMLNATLP